MSRDDVHVRDRLLLLAECSNPHRPLNVKRKSTLSKQGSKSGGGPKLSMQDFVRMDPGYTPDIEHLVFPGVGRSKRNSNPQQVAPTINPGNNQQPAKTRSRLAEMFALSRHLQQRSADREAKARNHPINRSVDSAMEPPGLRSASDNSSRSRRWVSAVGGGVAEPVRQSSITITGSNQSQSQSQRLSPGAECDMSAARGPNVSVLHLRSTSEPWETSPTSIYTAPISVSRPYQGGRTGGIVTHPPAQLTKHQSLGGAPSSQHKWSTSSNFHSGGEATNSTELFVGGTNTCNRELSPVRWCDREVDGVYLGRSGWVQVQQRSLDENRRTNYPPNVNSLQSRRTGIKLADYHCNSEPAALLQKQNSQQDFLPQSNTNNNGGRKELEGGRPGYLSLQAKAASVKTSNLDRKPPPAKSPSPSPGHRQPPLPPAESYSPPSLTPIISPPPAFQDRNKKSPKPQRSFFSGKAPFLPRSPAIVDSDVSPPLSPLMKWKSSSVPSAATIPVSSKQKLLEDWKTPLSSAGLHSSDPPPRAYGRIPQTKSLEDTTAIRRSQFIQKYVESSSSSSSSMGFRSLDSCTNVNMAKPLMPRLSENTDSPNSSVDVYEDADEEDNNSSSLNMSITNAQILNDLREKGPPREKVSPSGRSNRFMRPQMRRSPAGSDTNKPPTSPGSSSTSSCELPPSRSPMGSTQQIRRTAPGRTQFPITSVTKQQEDASLQRVRRSRSLQLPDRKNVPVINYRDNRDPSIPTRISPQQQQHPESGAGVSVAVSASATHRNTIKMGTSMDRMKRQQQAMTAKPLSLDPQQQGSGFLDEEMMREAEVVTGFLYGNRTRAAAQALLMHRYNNNIGNVVADEKPKEFPKVPSNNGLTVYFVGNPKKPQRALHRGSTAPIGGAGSKQQHHLKNPCSPETCDFWPHCAHRDNLTSNSNSSMMLQRDNFVTMRSSQSYPSHQRSLDSSSVAEGAAPPVGGGSIQAYSGAPSKMSRARTNATTPDRDPIGSDNRMLRRPSPNRGGGVAESGVFVGGGANNSEKKSSPVGQQMAFGGGAVIGSSSSSSSDVWLTTSDRTCVSNRGGGGGHKTAMSRSPDVCTPLPSDDFPCCGGGDSSSSSKREMILTRPGSAPAEEGSNSSFLESQQRSMSLPKSFLSIGNQHSGQLPWRRRGTESLGSSPGFPRKSNDSVTEPQSQTAPVTPLHEGNRRRSPLGGGGGGGGGGRRPKAASTPQLLDNPPTDNRKWADKADHPSNIETRHTQSCKDPVRSRNFPGNTAESVLQKFRKTFSLRFQKKGGSKEGCAPDTVVATVVGGDAGGALSEALATEPSEDDSPQHHRVPSGSSSVDGSRDELPEQKSRFGPLIWRSSKERKKLNKAARSAKCNSGDSGIQLEMVPGCGGAGDSSESHDTDPPGDDLDSPPSVRRRTHHHHHQQHGQQQQQQGKNSRPHSDLLNQILIDKFKSDLKQRAHRHHQVRRTRSDLGGQRLLHWDPKSSYRRPHVMSSTEALQSHRRHHNGHHKRSPPSELAGGVQLRGGRRNGQLRRSLSQPLDIDKLSPLMRTKTAGLRSGGSHVLSEDEHDGRIGTSEDEAMSDSESSIASLTERKKSLELAMDEEMVVLAEAVFDHVAIDTDELPFRAGDVIEVLETANREWWYGMRNSRTGWFPPQFVRLRVSQEDTVEDCLAAMASGRAAPSQIRRRTSISLLSNDQVRTSVVRELVHTERDFVKVLRDVAEGYMAECRKRTDMFSQDHIDTVFINLEHILRFQSEFLKDLEQEIDWDSPYRSCVGGCFLKHRAGFKMYSEYCNGHPMATAKLQELYQFNNYRKFFEACRLMRGLIEIPLDGYLLTPVQRICKYPLQLAELLKYTKQDHSDYGDIKEALEAMRGVAVLINERKRRMESLEKLAAWQQRVEGWMGEDLIERSSQLIHQGEVAKVATGMWTNNITMFLFDHQIIICKKDILKRNTYVYKSRMWTDYCEVTDVPDGKEMGVSVKNAIHLCTECNPIDNQGAYAILFCCRTLSEKQQWLKAFAKERDFVLQDKDNGLEFPQAARQLARMAARCQKRPPRKLRGSKNYKQHNPVYNSGSTLQLSSSNSNSLGRRMGTWFTFGGNKKSRHHQTGSEVP